MENKTLFSLAIQLEQLIIENDGEVSEEIDAMIHITEKDLATKVDSYYHVIERMKSAAEYYRKEAEKLNKVRKACETVEDRLKAAIKETMLFTGTKELGGNKHVFKLSDSQPRLVITDEAKIPAQYQIIRTEIDRAGLRVDLIHGKKVEGAHLEQTSALRTSFNKSPNSIQKLEA